MIKEIIQVVPTIGPGGAETFAAQLAIEFARRGISSKLLVLCDIRGERGRMLVEALSQAGVRLEVVGGKSTKTVAAVRAVARVLALDEQNTAVVVHLESSEVVTLCASICTVSRRRAVFRVIHSTVQTRGVAKLLEPITRRVFAGSIACSQEVAALNIAAQKPLSVAIDNGIDVHALSDISTTAHARMSKGQKRNCVFAIGSTRGGGIDGGVKGTDLAIQAIAKVLRTRDVHLILSGIDDSERSTVYSYLHSSGLPNGKVTIRGRFRSLEEEINLLQPRFAILPSRYEGLPLTLMEFSSLGVPVVVSNLPQVKRLRRPEFLWNVIEEINSECLALGILEELDQLPYTSTQLNKYIRKSRQDFGIEVCASKYLEYMQCER